MKFVRELAVNAVVGGLLVLLPLYLAVLLLLKALQTLVAVVRPVAALLPDWLPAQNLLALLLVLLICFGVGVLVRTQLGGVIRDRMQTLFSRVPGYTLFRSLTKRLAGNTDENVWTPALVEIEDALVPGFIIEEHDDGRLTVFVPSVPTPLAGAVYVLDRSRVHVVDVPFTQAVKVFSQWGAGSKELVAAMNRPPVADSPP
jgi:uncharacterized membrane protein